MANPAQGKGNYVLPWQAFEEFGSPTLYDVRLWEVLGKLGDIQPLTIRREALKIAADGLGGRHVAHAAHSAMEQEAGSESMILAAALAHFEATANQRRDSSAQDRRAPEDKDAIAEQLAKLPPDLADKLRNLARVLAGLGPPGAGETARLRRLASDMRAMLAEMKTLNATMATDQEAGALGFLTETIAQVLHYADLSIAEIDLRFGNLITLLQRPNLDLAKILDRVGRPEWLLDGWGVLLGLWHETPAEARADIAWDLIGITPTLPREVQNWFPEAVAQPTPTRIARVVTQGSDWRTGRLIELTARNENLISFGFNHENRISPAEAFRSRHQARVIIPKRDEAPTPSTPPPSATPVKPAPPSDLQLLAAGLHQASDENLMRIVGLIDGLPDRSGVDRLLARARPRLRFLKPPRKVTLTRLLFLPLSGAIVDAPDWLRDPGLIPRHALHPMAALIRDMLGASAQAIMHELQHEAFSNHAAIGRYGGALWDQASKIADRITPGSRWAEAGFTPEEFRMMMRLSVGVWRHAQGLWDVLRRGEAALPERLLRDALTGPATEGPDIFNAAFNTLLAQNHHAAQFVPLASGMPPGISEVVMRSLEAWVEQSLRLLQEDLLPAAVDRAEEISRTVELLRLSPYFQMARRRQQLSSFLWRLEEHCRLIMGQVLEQDILPALQAAAAPISDQGFAYLEFVARIAKRLEVLGKQLGNAAMYQEHENKLMKAFAAAEQGAGESALTQIDRIRLAEILLGQQMARSLIPAA
ncbi:MAG: hypothetical protein RIS83_1743 [Pseudomonadota bacterium]